MSASFTVAILEVLDDGTYLSELRPPRKRDGPPIRVRVIEYTVPATDADGEQVSELFSPGHHPARPRAGPRRRPGRALPRPVAGRDRHRGDQDRGPRRPGVVPRSKTPAMVAQEFWAMLCVYQAVRHLITPGRPTGAGPSRISFKPTIAAARDSATRVALSPRGA